MLLVFRFKNKIHLLFICWFVFFIIPEKGEHEDHVEHEFKSEEFICMSVPFVIDDHLNWFIWEQAQIRRVCQNSSNWYFITTFDFSHVDIVVLHLIHLLVDKSTYLPFLIIWGTLMKTLKTEKFAQTILSYLFVLFVFKTLK